MLHYGIELAIWLLIAYLIGCLLGWIFRNLFGSKTIAEPLAVAAAVVTPAAVYKPAPAAAPAPAAPVLKPIPPPSAAASIQVRATALPVAPAARPAIAVKPIPVAPRVVAPAAPGKMEKPKGLASARGGKADNLQRISGIGPKNESILHKLGFFHFDQIAAWTATEVTWVDDHLRFGGRIAREEWIKQAGLLATGKEAEFTKLYGTGGLRGAKGETLSGSRTRK